MTTNRQQGRYAIFRDDTGRLRIEATGASNPVVADFLFTDVREDLARCNSVLDMVERARVGPDVHIETVGNLYALVLRSSGARIENLFDEHAPSAEIALDELSALLQAWKSHLA